jgi:fatty-acyl-CoA synthase
MCTPLSHAGAAFFTPTVVKGGEMVVLGKFDPAEVLKVIEEQKITATMLVPSMLYALMDHPDSHTRDLSSLETVYYGASAMNPVRLAEAIRRFGPIFAQYYGQSEAPMVITYLAKADHDEKRLTSCGRPTLFARVALLGEDGTPVPQGEPGEICVSGPLLAGGYWHLPDETSKTFKDGWLHTGDMARLDEEGFVQIVDRKKDMVNRGGENVYCVEVENALAAHPAVFEVAVTAVPDAMMGEKVGAVIVPKPGQNPAIADILAFARTQLADFKVPQYIVLRTAALPRNPGGKVIKKQVRQDIEWGKQVW